MLLRGQRALADFLSHAVSLVASYSLQLPPPCATTTTTTATTSKNSSSTATTTTTTTVTINPCVPSNCKKGGLSCEQPGAARAGAAATLTGLKPPPVGLHPTLQPRAFGRSLSQALLCLFQRHAAPGAGTVDGEVGKGDTWVLPCVQMGAMGVRQDEEATLRFLGDAEDGARLGWLAGGGMVAWGQACSDGVWLTSSGV